MNDGIARNRKNGIPTKSNNTSETQPKILEINEPQKDQSEMTDLEAGNNTNYETEAKQEKPCCRVCEDNEAIVVFKPCGHIVLCAGIL